MSLNPEQHEFSSADQTFMARAIELAKRGHYTTSPNPRVGCVLVLNGIVVGEGYHQKAGSAHAEVNALNQANEHAGNLAQGATAYVTLEPCSHFGRTPPCAQTLIKAQVSKVIIAMVDPNPQVAGKGIKLLEAAGITTQVGLLNCQARALNVGFIKLMTEQKPFVRLKMATSLDGKTAMASGESKWITGVAARQDVQRLRAQSCAVICGADSVIIDQAKMTVRHDDLGELADNYPKNELRQPVRIVIDSQNRLTPDLALFKQTSPIILIRSRLENLPLWPHFVEQVQITSLTVTNKQQKIDLTALLFFLAKRGFNDVLIESGARLAGAFVEQNLVDELILYQAPKLMGADGKSMFAMPKIEKLADAKSLIIKNVTMVGQDLRIVGAFTQP